jgi:hypothetical protein
MASPYIELVCGELLYAMLGAVTSTLRAVSFACRTNQEVRLRFIVEDASDSDREMIRDIVQEFEAYHVDRVTVQYDIVESPDPLKSLDHLEHLVFAQYEGERLGPGRR